MASVPGGAGTFYLVPTPIGNLEDITLRALRVLGSARLVLAEDTRTTLNLFRHHAIATPLKSYTEQKHAQRLESIVQALAEGDVALVSDAGMPGLNDPGQALVAELVARGFRVEALPGPSAVPVAVVLAGFPVPSFTFAGFVPKTASGRRALFERQRLSSHALVAFESPHRLLATLAAIEEALPSRRLAVCRELSKLHEEVFRGTAAEALQHFSEPRGEIVLVVAGASDAEATGEDEVSDGALGVFMAEQRAGGAASREAIGAAMARFGVRRRRAYAAWNAEEP